MKNRSAFSRVLVSLIMLGSLSSLRAQGPVVTEEFVAPEYVSPVFSLSQIVDLKNRFVFWVDKYRRCLFGGRCKRTEKEQVLSELNLWGKRLGKITIFAILTYLGYAKGIPALEEKLASRKEAFKEEIVTFSEKLVEKMSEKVVVALNSALAKATRQVDDLISLQRQKILAEGGDVSALLQQLAKIRSESLAEAKETASQLLKEGATTFDEVVEKAINKALERLERLEATIPLMGKVTFEVKEGPEEEPIVPGPEEEEQGKLIVVPIPGARGLLGPATEGALGGLGVRSRQTKGNGE